jgi:hypothetical protein
MVFASGTLSPGPSPRKRMKDNRSLIRNSARSSERLFCAWMTRIMRTGSKRSVRIFVYRPPALLHFDRPHPGIGEKRPLGVEGLQRVPGGLGSLGAIDLAEPGRHRLAVLPGAEFERVANEMDDAGLDRRLGEGRVESMPSSLLSVLRLTPLRRFVCTGGGACPCS